MKILKFPKGFFWGAGTSAIQCEGGNEWSDWSYFEAEKPFVKSGEKIGITSDHYNRYKDDLRLAKDLNHNAHRFTIEWSRIEKTQGEYDQKEIDYYKEKIRYIKSLGMEPFPTLHHFSNPAWLTLTGGWANKKSVDYFLKFTKTIVDSLGDDINYWLTINEPNTYIGLGYLLGSFPPLKHNPLLGFMAIKNMARAHNQAYRIIKKVHPKSKIGAINNIQLVTSKEGKTGSPLQRVADYFISYYFPSKTYRNSDFIGLNYYFPTRTKRTKERTDMGWEIYPKGLYDSVMRTWNKYKLPIIITENGIADSSDKKRYPYISEHLRYLHRAITEGADVWGYLYWTLIDNLELMEGYGPKFGLIGVNFSNQKRMIKKSVLEYGIICKNNSLTADGYAPIPLLVHRGHGRIKIGLGLDRGKKA